MGGFVMRRFCLVAAVVTAITTPADTTEAVQRWV
jgi:hypothetical protein